MALSLASPCGVLSDDEEGGAAVFESTAADLGALRGALWRCGAPLPEVSLISPELGPPTPQREKSRVKAGVEGHGREEEAEGCSDRVKVHLRIRPLTEGEQSRGEEQGCVCVQDGGTLLLRAPKSSSNTKSSERGGGTNVHKFTFTQISGPDTSQQEFYERAMKEMVQDVLRGENRLLYTYGVTNSGKTYTVQVFELGLSGTGREAGLLPRALGSVFRRLQGRLYGALDLKPVLCQEVRWLDSTEVRCEEQRRNALLNQSWSAAEQKSSGPPGGSSSCDSGIGGVSVTAQLEDSDSVCLDAEGPSHSGEACVEDGVRVSVWVSFCEIYNEFLYDLLEAPAQHKRTRPSTREPRCACASPGVRSAEEAWKILKVGRRNQSFASTHLNHNSSRSHSIFSMRLLHIHPENDSGKGTRISLRPHSTVISMATMTCQQLPTAPPAAYLLLSVCDLAGSERCKEQQSGERMKEATNINTSLHTLGRCITALRDNQSHRLRLPLVVPFRDSKLTRVLQGFFSGRGRSCMVVNISPGASAYDETLHALKFSAIATQLVHGPSTKSRVAYILSLLREPAQRANQSALMEEEEEEEDSDEEEGDITMFDSEVSLP
ncbi:hypothetical protein AAFF_G00388620 [Aldrovandia affinis]|uniref:Kinesin motor domain-containing protein n=1 Tax=Aldrovandia affinis TaxID=143900 RepID=A0AAD7R4N0_9TELE|nr:hypothetical protein AAFF_G00388620 [Aldrovandia affinis]